MRAQIDFSRTPLFLDFLNGLFSLEIGEKMGQFVQGVVVDLHPLWRAAWRFQASTGMSPDDWLWNFPSRGIFPGGVDLIDAAIPPDPNWSCGYWEDIKRNNKKEGGGPFLVKICTRPMSPSAIERQILQNYANQQLFFCILEERAPARALASVQGGTEITAGVSRGTLGGFLQDQNGSVYGLTCAHVAMSANGAFDLLDVGGANLPTAATVARTASKLTKLSPGQLCNRTATSGQNPDVALLSLGWGHFGQSSVRSIGIVDDVLTENDLGSGSLVELRGGVSGYHSAYIGGYSVVYNVLFMDGNEYCFDHMFEVVTRSTSRFSGLIPPALAAKPVSGDSGAWVCAPSRSTPGKFGFAGMLAAGDGANAYVCFADAILDWAVKTHGLTLSPL